MEIRIDGLEKSFGTRAVLHSITLSVKAGENVGIIGPNGSGKSTLLKCVYRVLEPDGGAIYLGGDLLSELPVRESARREAVLSQHHTSGFDFRVMEVVLMGRSPYKGLLDRYDDADRRLAEAALASVGMEAFRNHSFQRLSGGEQQRVMLARALTQDTPCLILDEPTNHLDIRYQLQIMDHVRRTKKTVVAAIHDLNIAAHYCDRLVAMKEGRILCEGAPKEVLTESFIRALYGVRASVLTPDDGTLVIAFRLD